MKDMYNVNEEDGGFSAKSTYRSNEVAVDWSLEVDLDLLLPCMDCEVHCFAPNTAGLGHGDRESVCFPEEERTKRTQTAHGRRDVYGPAPVEI